MRYYARPLPADISKTVEELTSFSFLCEYDFDGCIGFIAFRQVEQVLWTVQERNVS